MKVFRLSLYNFCQLAIGIFVLDAAFGKISNLRKCGDKNCQKIISQGRTTQMYHSTEKSVLSFKIDQSVEVYSKEAGDNFKLWGVKINGRTGYVPSRFVKEEKEFLKKDQLKFIVPTELIKETNNLNSNSLPINEEAKIKDIDKEDKISENNDPSFLNANDHDYNMLKKLDYSKLVNEDAKIESTEKLTKPEDATKANDNQMETNKVEERLKFNNEGNVNLQDNIAAADAVIKDPTVIEESPTPEDASKDSSSSTIPIASSNVVEVRNQGEVDNEDEGNGNEGEENGSEVQLEVTQTEEQKSIPPTDAEELNEQVHTKTDSIQSQSEVSEEQSNSDEESTQKNTDFEAKPENVKTLPAAGVKFVENVPLSLKNSNKVGVNFKENAQHDLSPEKEKIEKLSKSDISSEELISYHDKKLPESKDTVSETKPTPTPVSEYEIVDGTTIYLYDQTSPYPEEDNLLVTTQTPLQGSQVNEDQGYTTEPTPIVSQPPMERMTTVPPPTEMPPNVEPIALKFVNKNTISQAEKTIVDDSVAAEENNTSQREESAAKEDSDFASPKAESILENIQEATSQEPQTNMPTNDQDFEFRADLNSEESSSSFEEKSLPSDEASLLPEEASPSDSEDEVPAKPSFFSSLFSTSTESSENEKDSKEEEPPVETNTVDNKTEAEPPTTDETNKPKDVEDLEYIHYPQTNEADQSETPQGPEDIIASSPTPLDDQEQVEDLLINVTYSDPMKNGKKHELEDESTKESQYTDTPVDQNAEHTLDMGSYADRLLNMSEPLWNTVLVHLTQLSEGLALSIEGELAEPHMSTGSVVFLMIVSGTILTLYFIHIIMVKLSRESPLLEAMNKLDRQYKFSLEQCDSLKKQLSQTNGQIKNVNPAEMQQMKLLQDEYQSKQMEYNSDSQELRERIFGLEKDLETSLADVEMLHNMNSDLLTSQKETSNFEESVDCLQSMLDAQMAKVENLTSDLSHKNRMNDELRNESKSLKTKSAKLEHQIEQLMKSLEEVNSGKEESLKRLDVEEAAVTSLREINASLRQEVDDIRRQLEGDRTSVERAKSAIKQVKDKLHAKEAECQVARECLKKLQLSGDGTNNVQGKLDELFHVVEVKSRLVAREKERDSLREQLECVEKSNETLKEQERATSNELSKVRETLKQIQTDRDQTKSKLSVLSQFYEEKEAKLKKQLESQEELRLDAEGSASNICNRIQAYEYEISSLREKIESLKNEFEEQKNSYKMQLTNEEKKAHESWIASRAAERRQEELRQENTQLRQRLSIFHNQDRNSKKEANGVLSPPLPLDPDAEGHMDPLMMRPPLPPMFNPSNIPPPPPGLPPPGLPPGLPPPWAMPPMMPPPPGSLPPDRRMPPAGRMASPPGYDRRSYSPGSDHSRYSDHPRYSPGPPRYSPHRSRRLRLREPPSPTDSMDRHSPDHWFMRPPHDTFKRHRSPPRGYYGEADNDTRRPQEPHHIGKKTSTPLGPNDR